MRNLTLEEYISCSEVSEYSPLQYMKPSESFGKYKSDIENMTYEQVKGVVRTLRKLDSWNDIKDIFETVYQIDEQQFLNSYVKDFFAAKNFIIEKFKQIVETEYKLLKSINKNYGKWIAAGGERLNRFSDVLPLNQLGKIYGIYPFELKDYKYKEILLLLTIEKEQSEIEQKMHEK